MNRALKLAALLSALLVIPTPLSHAQVEKTHAEALLGAATSTDNCEVEVRLWLKRWQEDLRLGDWSIDITCEVLTQEAAKEAGVPESIISTYIGLTLANTDSRKALVLIHPKAKTPRKKIVLHELVHIILLQSRAAQSTQVDEQLTQAVTDAILGNHKKD